MLVKGKKHSAKHTPGMSRKVMVVLTTLIIGVVCYSVTAYAWFQANIASSGNVIATATFDVAVEIPDAASVSDGVYHLEKGKSYQVTLKRTGEANGYCVIQGNQNTWCTELIGADAFTFTLNPEADGEYSFTATWGTPSKDSGLIANGSTIGQLVVNQPVEESSGLQESESAEQSTADVSATESSEEVFA